MTVWAILADLFLAFAAARALGALAVRYGQPAVLGQLAAGLLLAWAFPVAFHPQDPALAQLARWGVLLLLFRTGMESDWPGLKRAGPSAFRVAMTGVALPFALGLAAVRAWGCGWTPALFAAAALTATSVGVTAGVLLDLDCLHLPEAEIILAAAVLDDILGLMILLALPGAAFGGGGIVAAFAAGLWLSSLGLGRPLGWLVKPLEKQLAPFFFVAAGAQLGALPAGGGLRETLALTALLTAAAVAGKLASGWTARDQGLNRWAIGVGMLPRGEVGLLFAQAGLAGGALGRPLYAAILGMIAITTFVAPPWLKRILR